MARRRHRDSCWQEVAIFAVGISVVVGVTLTAQSCSDSHRAEAIECFGLDVYNEKMIECLTYGENSWQCAASIYRASKYKRECE